MNSIEIIGGVRKLDITSAVVMGFCVTFESKGKKYYAVGNKVISIVEYETLNVVESITGKGIALIMSAKVVPELKILVAPVSGDLMYLHYEDNFRVENFKIVHEKSKIGLMMTRHAFALYGDQKIAFQERSKGHKLIHYDLRTKKVEKIMNFREMIDLSIERTDEEDEISWIRSEPDLNREIVFIGFDSKDIYAVDCKNKAYTILHLFKYKSYEFAFDYSRKYTFCMGMKDNTFQFIKVQRLSHNERTKDKTLEISKKKMFDFGSSSFQERIKGREIHINVTYGTSVFMGIDSPVYLGWSHRRNRSANNQQSQFHRVFTCISYDDDDDDSESTTKLTSRNFDWKTIYEYERAITYYCVENRGRDIHFCSERRGSYQIVHLRNNFVRFEEEDDFKTERIEFMRCILIDEYELGETKFLECKFISDYSFQCFKSFML